MKVVRVNRKRVGYESVSSLHKELESTPGRVGYFGLLTCGVVSESK